MSSALYVTGISLLKYWNIIAKKYHRKNKYVAIQISGKPQWFNSVLALQTNGRWFHSPLLQYFGWDYIQRSCLHDLVVR